MMKLLLVAQREYVANVKRRSFLIASVGVPLLLIGLMAIIILVSFQNESDLDSIGRVGYVDDNGLLTDAVEVPDTFSAYATADEARAALIAGDIGAYFVVAPDYLRTGEIDLSSRSGTPDALQDQIDAFLVANIARSADAAVVARLQDPVNVSLQTLDNGRILRDDALLGVLLAPMLFVVVFLIATSSTSSYIMSSVVEEKSNRIMEILVTSVTPFQLLGGKILGLCLVGLTQLAIWFVGFALVTRLGNGVPLLSGFSLPPDLLIVGVIYFLLDYFLTASIFACIASVIGSEQESRQVSGLFSFVFSIPFFFIVQFISEPNGAVVTALTLIPFTSPIAVLMRMGFGTIPLWQLLLSIALLAVTALLVAWLSARIFRWSLLMYGKRPSLRELLRALRQSGMGTSATEPTLPAREGGR